MVDETWRKPRLSDLQNGSLTEKQKGRSAVEEIEGYCRILTKEQERLMREVGQELESLRARLESGERFLKPLGTRFLFVEYGPHRKRVVGWQLNRRTALIKSVDGFVYRDYQLYHLERFLPLCFAEPIYYEEWSEDGLKRLLDLLRSHAA